MITHAETMHFVARENDTVDKLVLLAGGDLDVVTEAIWACSRTETVGWWKKRQRLVSDLSDVVRYITSRMQY